MISPASPPNSNPTGAAPPAPPALPTPPASPTPPAPPARPAPAPAEPAVPDPDGVHSAPVPSAPAGRDAEEAEEAEELARLRTEVTQLHSRLDTRNRRAVAVRALRRVTAAVLVTLAAFGLVASVVGLWAATTTLNTNRWVATVAPLPKDPQVAAAVSQYATTEVFQVLNVEQRLREVLPEQAAFLVGPLTTQVRQTVQNTVTTVLQSDQFQKIWVEANRRAHERAMAIIEGTSSVVVARGDRVDIDLLPLINQVLRQLSDQLPTLFGKQLSLPDLSSGEIPANLRTRVQDALGVTLPANFAQFTMYDAGRLRAIQEAVNTVKRDLAILVVSSVVLLGLALLVSPARRRTVLQLGVWLVIAAVAVTASLRAVRRQLLEQVPAGTYRDGVSAALTTITGTLRERGVQLIWLGAILALVAYLVGPGRAPVWLRHQVARGARTGGRWTRDGAHVVASRGPGWTARHLDAIRIAGVIVAAVLALLLSSWTSLLVIVIVLAAFEIGVTLVGRLAPPDAQHPAGVAR